MTDKALLIAALRQCAEKLEDCDVADASVREYRLLADLCESKPDAEEKLREACGVALESLRAWNTIGFHGAAAKQMADIYENSSEVKTLKAALAIADGAK